MYASDTSRNPLNPLFYCIQLSKNTHVSSGEGLEGNRRTIRASPPNLKLDYIVKKKKEKEIVRKVAHTNC